MDEIIDCLKDLTNAHIDSPNVMKEDKVNKEVTIGVKFLDEVTDDLISSYIYLFVDKDDGGFIIANTKHYEISEMSVWLSLFFNKDHPSDYHDVLKENATLKNEIEIMKGSTAPSEIIIDGW
jgi:hypothetical protein